MVFYKFLQIFISIKKMADSKTAKKPASGFKPKSDKNNTLQKKPFKKFGKKPFKKNLGKDGKFVKPAKTNRKRKSIDELTEDEVNASDIELEGGVDGVIQHDEKLLNGNTAEIEDLDEMFTTDPDTLGWKSVEIDHRVNDFEGFFGLEELEGVAVERQDNGKVKFVTKDKKDEKEEGKSETKKPKNKKEKKTKKKEVEKQDTEEPQSESATQKEQEPEEEKKEENEEEEIDTSNLNWDFHEKDDEGNVIPDSSKDVNLSPYATKALAALKFNTPTEIQRKAIPVILKGHDVIGKAATGSGKTLAYGLPILERHLELVTKLQETGTEQNDSDKNEEHKSKSKKSWPTAIIFSPTRELAIQIVKHITALSKYYPIIAGTSGVVPVTGGLAIQKQQRLIENNPAVIVATPGRFLELLESSNAIIEKFSKAEMLVLDEADRMLQEGHFKELNQALDLLGDQTQNNKKARFRTTVRQTLVFSATFQRDLMNKLGGSKKSTNVATSGRLSSNDEAISYLKKKLRFKEKMPTFVDANPAEAVASKVHESIIECGAMEKDLFLYYFTLLYPGRTIVFVNSIDAVKRLQPFFRELGMPVTGIHSNMIQKQRLRALEKFRANDNSVLIATDVAARGLDIPLIQHVVHYHLPRTADMYVHRSGRTARAGSEGVSVIICSPEEASGPLIKLKKVLYKDSLKSSSVDNRTGSVPPSLKPLEINYEILPNIRRRVKLAKTISDSLQETTYKGKGDSWLSAAADDLGVDLKELESLGKSQKGWHPFRKSSDEAKMVSPHELKKLRAELHELLEKPIFAGRSISTKYLTSGSVNLADMVLSGKSHNVIIGHEKGTALEAVSNPKKKRKTK